MDTSQAIKLALQHHRAGQLDAAEAIYRDILALQPKHSDSLHLLGIIAHQRGRPDDAIELIQRAIKINPSVPTYHYNIANILRELGRRDEAAEACREAIRLKSDYAEPYYTLGNALLDGGQVDQAIAAYREAIRLKPDYAPTIKNLGGALAAKGLIDEAIDLYQQAVRLAPDYAEAHSDLAVALRQKGQLEDAVAACRRALQHKPDYAEAYNNLGSALNEQGRFADAIMAYKEAIRLKPGLCDAYYNLGITLYQSCQPEDSATYRQPIRPTSDDTDGYKNPDGANRENGQFTESIAAFRRAAEIKPDFAEAYFNLAAIQRDMLELDEAIASCRKAIQIRPDYADAHFTLSLNLLKKGNFVEGWPEYEWRWKRDGEASRIRHLTQPRWDGTELHGRTILLHAEQGFGDTIQFIRYAPLVAARGGRVIVEGQAALKRLLSQVPSVAQFIAAGEPLPEFDAHCPLLSLPLIFQTDLNSIPASAPYLRVDARLSAQWKERLKHEADLHRVGLVWAGSPSQLRDRYRSAKLEYFAPFVDMKDVVFFSLQKGEAAKQHPPNGMRFRDHTAQLNDFSDTAALLENLDLVITVDTAVAHLAGAMGKRVWVLLSYSPDWRWLLDREDCPWYPTMRLFRQKKLGDWDDVIARVTRELADFSAERSGYKNQ